MKYIVILFFIVSLSSLAQERVEPKVDAVAHVKGIASDFDYVIKSQMIYPANLLKKNISQDVTVHFVVSSKGEISDFEFQNNYPNEFKIEAKRLLRFFIFEPAKIGNVNVASKTSVTIKFNARNYKRNIKPKSNKKSKELDIAEDTSFIVYERADVSPEYYKGEDAFKEYIVSNLEYPDIAIRQGLQGNVILSFIVETNGTISNLFVEKEFNHFCTQEAIRIMRDTKWISAKKDNKLVRYKMKYPITFNLNNINKDNATSEQR